MEHVVAVYTEYKIVVIHDYPEDVGFIWLEEVPEVGNAVEVAYAGTFVITAIKETTLYVKGNND